jgi:hypothetical protein
MHGRLCPSLRIASLYQPFVIRRDVFGGSIFSIVAIFVLFLDQMSSIDVEFAISVLWTENTNAAHHLTS